MAEPQHPHTATPIRAMKAILGYAAVNWLEARDDLIVGGMLLKDMRIGFCLLGARELWYSDWILKDYCPTVSVALVGVPQAFSLVPITCTLT